MKHYLRTWRKFDLQDIEKCLIVVGELSAECFSCRCMGLNSKTKVCPDCKVTFKYMGFRRNLRPAYLLEVKANNPEIVLIDFEDFKKSLGKREARKLLDI